MCLQTALARVCAAVCVCVQGRKFFRKMARLYPIYFPCQSCHIFYALVQQHRQQLSTTQQRKKSSQMESKFKFSIKKYARTNTADYLIHTASRYDTQPQRSERLSTVAIPSGKTADTDICRSIYILSSHLAIGRSRSELANEVLCMRMRTTRYQ